MRTAVKDVRQRTLATALGKIEDQGCEIISFTSVEKSLFLGLGSETTGLIVKVNCER